MSMYFLFDGGDQLRKIDDYILSKWSEEGLLEPAIHQKERNIVLRAFLDSDSFRFRGAYEGLGETKDFRVVGGDEIATHQVGAGWVVNEVVYHVKRAGTGVLKPRLRQFQYTETDGVYTRADDKVTALVGDDGEELVIDLSKPGWYRGRALSAPASSEVKVVSGVSDKKNGDGLVTSVTATSTNVIVPDPTSLPVLMQDNGLLSMVLDTTDADNPTETDKLPWSLCLGVFMSITNYIEEVECNCAPVPCETEYPRNDRCLPL